MCASLIARAATPSDQPPAITSRVCGPADARHLVEQVACALARRLERRAPDDGGGGVGADVDEPDAVVVQPDQLDPLGLDLERRALERVAPLRPDAEQRQHAAERRARAHRAEQVLALGDRVPADHDVVVDRLLDRLGGRAARSSARAPRRCPTSRARRPRRRRRRRPRRSGGRGRRPRAPRRAPAAARRRRGRAACRRRRARAAARRGAPDHSTVVVPPAARVQIEPAGARGERQLGALLAAEPVHDELADAQPARRRAAASGTWSRSQRYFATVRSARERSPVRRRGSAGSPRRSGAPPSSPRESCQAIEGTTGSPSRPSSTPVSAMPDTPIADHARVVDLGQRQPRRRQRARPRTPRARSRRRSAPASRRSAPGRARSPRRPG